MTHHRQKPYPGLESNVIDGVERIGIGNDTSHRFSSGRQKNFTGHRRSHSTSQNPSHELLQLGDSKAVVAGSGDSGPVPSVFHGHPSPICRFKNPNGDCASNNSVNTGNSFYGGGYLPYSDEGPASGSCRSMSKFDIFGFNIIFMMVGASVLSLGAWLRTDSRFRDFLSERYRQVVHEAIWKISNTHGLNIVPP